MPSNSSSKKKLGLWTCTSLVIGNMVGAGFFLLPAALASFGAVSLLGWLISAVGALLLARVFSNFSKLMPNADGGPYAYTRQGFGDFAGFLVAWGYWISCWTSNAAIAVSLVGSLSIFFPPLATQPVPAVMTGLSAIWLLTWINSRGIRATGVMQLITTILKLAPLILISVVGFFYIHWSYFIPFNISGGSVLSAITASATLTLFAFVGVESATIPAGNVADPAKTIPRATMIGTIVTICIYIMCTISVMGIIQAKTLAHSVAPIADAAAVIWGSSARYWVGAGVVIAAFGALNGWILIQAQIPYAIAKDKLFPAIFGRENRNGVPGGGLVISSILVSVLMVMNFTRGLVEQFKFLLLLSIMSSLVPYIFVTAAYVITMIEHKYVSRKGWISIIVLASLAFLFSLWAVIGSGETSVFWGFILLLAGIPVYVWMLWKNKARGPVARGDSPD